VRKISYVIAARQAAGWKRQAGGAAIDAIRTPHDAPRDTRYQIRDTRGAYPERPATEYGAAACGRSWQFSVSGSQFARYEIPDTRYVRRLPRATLWGGLRASLRRVAGGDFVPNVQRSGDKMAGTWRFFLLLAGQGVAAGEGSKRGEIFVPNVQHHPFVEADVFPPVPAGRNALKKEQRVVSSFKFAV